MTKEINIRDVKLGGNNPFALIAGPCVIESEVTVMDAASRLKQIDLGTRHPFHLQIFL